MRLSRWFLISLAIIFSVSLYSPARAQEDEPYYIVQEGDSLWEIAARFGVSLEDLQRANNINDPGRVVIGARLIIPGLIGVSGRLDTVAVAYGETVRSLSRRYALSGATLARLNHFISLSELYAGATLIVPMTENQNSALAGRAALASGQSLLELAIVRNEDPWSLALDNNLPGTSTVLPGDVLHVAGDSQADAPTGLPDAITKVEVAPLLMMQGGTTVLKSMHHRILRSAVH